MYLQAKHKKFTVRVYTKFIEEFPHRGGVSPPALLSEITENTEDAENAENTSLFRVLRTFRGSEGQIFN